MSENNTQRTIQMLTGGQCSEKDRFFITADQLWRLEAAALFVNYGTLIDLVKEIKEQSGVKEGLL